MPEHPRDDLGEPAQEDAAEIERPDELDWWEKQIGLPLPNEPHGDPSPRP